MSLMLPHRWEHALIAATIEAAKKECPHCHLGRTAVQKLLYFMKVLGVPMRYSFDIHHYGPFCANIMHDVDWLLTDEVIQDSSSNQEASDYTTNHEWPELKTQFGEKLGENQQIIESVCHALSDLSSENLELIATLDFSYRWVHAKGGDGPWKPAAVEKFKSIKKDKFSNAQIDNWYDKLVSAHLIEA